MSTERPILFSTPMVQALLAGRKTQTRRIVKCQPEPEEKIGPCPWVDSNWAIQYQTGACKCREVKCPWQVGDILWVRESFRVMKGNITGTEYDFPDELIYKADDTRGPFKPSIHMPKSACRIWLEITEIRVERVTDIAEEDSCWEGIGSDEHGELWEDYAMANDPERFRFTEPSESFQSLWKKINGPESWEANP